MDWADELAARVRDRGPQVVNDSKTPSGTVHVGSLRGPVILDVIVRALRANGIETTFLYGVDDLDPMDAQALLTPDAVDHEMGRPLAHVPDQVGDGHASYARHHAQTFIDVFAGPRHPPRPLLLDERHLSDRRDGPVHPDRARQGCAGARDLPASRQRPASRHVAPARRHLPDVRQGRHDDRDPVGRRSRVLRVPSDAGHLGPRLRLVRLDLAVRRSREAALEPRVGGAMVAVRRDDRALRQGPVHRRRLPRPQRRHRPRGLRTRAAAQRALRVPQHRRQEDVDLEGPRRRGARDRRGRSRPSSSGSCSSVHARTTRSSSIPRAPTRSRGCSTSSTSSRPRPPAARSRASSRRATRPRSGTPCSIRTPTSRPRPLPSGRRSRTSRSSSRSPASTSRARVEAEKGSALTERERQILDERVAAARAWLEAYAPDSARLAVQREAIPAAAAGLDDAQRRFLATLSRCRRADGARRAAMPGRRSIFDAARSDELARTPGVRGDLPRVPRAPERAARRLAPREPRPRVRHQNARARRPPATADGGAT